MLVRTVDSWDASNSAMTEDKVASEFRARGHQVHQMPLPSPQSGVPAIRQLHSLHLMAFEHYSGVLIGLGAAAAAINHPHRIVVLDGNASRGIVRARQNEKDPGWLFFVSSLKGSAAVTATSSIVVSTLFKQLSLEAAETPTPADLALTVERLET